VYGASARTAVLDMTRVTPAWRETAPMNYARSYQNLTLLPDGTAFASGGMATSDGVDLSQAVLPTEIWDPGTETWTTTASMSVGREYHSTALLLPDGRVLMAGGGQLPGSTATNEYNAQLYSPPYLFKGSRPTIGSAPSLVQYGSTFQISTPDAAGIASVSLIRTPAVTHDFDQNQRFLPLTFTQGNGVLTVQAPAQANLAPPGYYMLFIVNASGVPSVASFVRFPAPYEDTVAPSAPGTLAATGGTGTVSLAWSAATDNVGVDHYEVYRATTSGFTPSLLNRIATTPGTSYVDGVQAPATYYYRVKAVDLAGNLSPASNEASGSAAADTTAPAVSVTAPAPGSTASGAVVVAATASDDVAVTGVQFKLDGATLGAEDTVAPYSILWDSTTVTNGAHTLTAVARDAAGNTTTSEGVGVNVANSAPPVLVSLVGDQAVEPKIDGNTAGAAEAFSTTATTTGTAKQLSFFVDASAAATTLTVGLYTDGGGHPGVLLTQATVTAPQPGAWNAALIPAAAVVAGNSYWLAILSPAGAGSVKFRNRCCGGGTPAEMSASTALSALPPTWASGVPYRDGPLSAFASG
jgi:fibronectin type 3 domain-containing protein